MGGGSGGGLGGYGGSTGGVKGPRNGGNGGFGGGSGGSGSGTGGGFGGGSDGSFSGGGEYGDFLTEVLQSVGIGPGASLKDSASKYPESNMMVRITEVPDDGTHNATLQVGVAEEAARMQTLKEHNDAINKFLEPGQTPAQRAEALRKGREAERKLLSFWADDRPRVNYTPSSSAVEAVRITSDNRVEVKWRHSKKTDNDGFYTFLPSKDPFEASLAFQQLVTAPSLGRAVYPVVSRPLKKFNKYINNNWNQKHYDPSKATAKVR